MRAILTLIILGDGVAAGIGALICALMRTTDHRWPKLFRVISVWYLLYAIARLGTTWNTITNAREAIECAGLRAPVYIQWFLTFSGLMAINTWLSVIALIMFVMNGHLSRLWNRILRRK